MPCFTIQETKVDLGKVNPDILQTAMASLNVSDYVIRDGKVVIRSANAPGEAQIKRAYSEAVVMTQAKRFGWNVQKQTDGKLLVQKARL